MKTVKASRLSGPINARGSWRRSTVGNARVRPPRHPLQPSCAIATPPQRGFSRAFCTQPQDDPPQATATAGPTRALLASDPGIRASSNPSRGRRRFAWGAQIKASYAARRASAVAARPRASGAPHPLSRPRNRRSAGRRRRWRALRPLDPVASSRSEFSAELERRADGPAACSPLWPESRAQLGPGALRPPRRSWSEISKLPSPHQRHGRRDRWRARAPGSVAAAALASAEREFLWMWTSVRMRWGEQSWRGHSAYRHWSFSHQGK